MWKPYPKHRPKKRGWYICSIRYGEDPRQAYVMDLFWDEKTEQWKDNRRLDVYNTYKVSSSFNYDAKVQQKLKRVPV